MPIRSWQPLISLALGLGIGVAAMVLGQVSPDVRSAETSLFDWRLRLTRVVTDPAVVLVPLDAATATRRHVLASLVTTLGRQGSRVIGLDVPLDGASTPEADHALAQALASVSGVVASAQLTGTAPPRYTLPRPEFQVTSGLNMPVRDADGTVRRAQVLQPAATNLGHVILRPTYLLELLRRIDPAAAARWQSELAHRPWGFRPAGPWAQIGVADLLAGRRNGQGAIVLVGEEASLRWQAPALQALLQGRPVRQTSPAFNFALCLLAGTVCGLLFGLGRPLVGLMGSLGVMAGLTVANLLLFIGTDHAAWLLAPAVAAAGTGTAGFAQTLLQAHSRRRRVARFFRPYVSPQTVEALLRDPENLPSLKSERRVVTVLFSDIAGFTSMSERLPTEEVVQLLNEYLTAMTRIIFHNHGTLDKYIGDEVMAVFGNIGPNEPIDDAYRAVKSALEMQEELSHLQEKWLSEGILPLQIRIGINSGEALVGNIGSPQQMDFTVIGDMVNTAKRLEGLNKAYNTNILISQATYAYVKDRVETRFLGPAPIKGRHEPVPVYALLGWGPTQP